MTALQNNSIPIETKSRRCCKLGKYIGMLLLLLITLGVSYISYEVYIISKQVSSLNISDDKMEYVYNKVTDLVNILNSKETDVSYDPTEKYDFKPPVNELVSDVTQNEQIKNEDLRQELSKLNDSDKLKIVRDKVISMYQKSREKNDEMDNVKQSFTEAKQLIENWYNDKKNIRQMSPVEEAPKDSSVVGRLKNNLSKFVQISKTDSANDKKVLTVDQIPQMLSYAEILVEAGSLSQAVWIMEDIENVTRQEDIFAFTARAEIYLDNHKSSNTDQQLKELIEIIGN